MLCGIYITCHFSISIYICSFNSTLFNNRAIQSQVLNRIEKEKTTVRIQDDGLYIGINTCQTLYNYQCIHHIENKYGYLIIRISTGLFLAIPDHAFSDSTERDEFKALLESKIAH